MVIIPFSQLSDLWLNSALDTKKKKKKKKDNSDSGKSQ